MVVHLGVRQWRSEVEGLNLSSRLDDEGLRTLLALKLVRGLGDIAIVRLLGRYGSAPKVWEAVAQEEPMEGVRAPALATLRRGPDWSAVDGVIARLKQMGAWVVHWGGPGYPEALQCLYHPPVILYGLGDPTSLNASAAVAVVGARRATSYGLRVARELSRELARHGVATVSGFALGIDGAAHRGSLEGGGTTIAVLGCGLDVDYPRAHRRLRREVAERGALVSEFEPGVLPDPKNFPRRNRIISGLARGVLVVEAGMKSGSLITASYALEQGREVFAVPGSIFSPVSRGTHWLIRQGATLVASAEELVEELGMDRPSRAALKRDGVPEDPPLGPGEKQVLEVMEAYPLHIDEIADRARMPAAEVARILVNLELDDMVSALPGHMYQLR